MSKREELIKKMDEIMDLAKKELVKVDPKTGLPGTLIDKKEHMQKGPNFNFKPGGAPTPQQFSDSVRQTFGSTDNKQTPPPPQPSPTPTKKSDHKGLADMVRGALDKCMHLKKQGPTNINPTAAAGIQSGFQGATGSAGISQGIKNLGSALGFGKSELEKKSKHDKCVEEVSKNPEVSNAHAVCVAAGVRPSKWKKSEIEDTKFEGMMKSYFAKKQEEESSKAIYGEHSDEKSIKANNNPDLQKDANPDMKADAKLGEDVEHLVEDHMIDNKDAERKEGHKIMEKHDSKSLAEAVKGALDKCEHLKKMPFSE